MFLVLLSYIVRPQGQTMAQHPGYDPLWRSAWQSLFGIKRPGTMYELHISTFLEEVRPGPDIPNRMTGIAMSRWTSPPATSPASMTDINSLRMKHAQQSATSPWPDIQYQVTNKGVESRKKYSHCVVNVFSTIMRRVDCHSFCDNEIVAPRIWHISTGEDLIIAPFFFCITSTQQETTPTPTTLIKKIFQLFGLDLCHTHINFSLNFLRPRPPCLQPGLPGLPELSRSERFSLQLPS